MTAFSSVNQRKARIWSDRRYVEKRPWINLFLPFWGKTHEGFDDYPYNNVFDAYIEKGKDAFELCPLESSDCAILPFEWSLTLNDSEARNDAESFIATASAAEKRTLVFYYGDPEIALNDPRIVFLKPSCRRSMDHAGVISIPFWGCDISRKYAADAWRPAIPGQAPSIGFCGAAYNIDLPSSWSRIKAWINFVLRRHRDHCEPAGIAVRGRALRALRSSRFVRTDFLLRENSWFVTGDKNTSGYSDIKKSHEAFAGNMLRNPFTLCVRGAGNFSVRFYEVLSAGRIPVFVNTDCVLPLENLIPWRDLCVWVEESEVESIDSHVQTYFERLCPVGIVERQEEILMVWEKFVRPDAFYRILADKIANWSACPAQQGLVCQ